MQILRDDFLKIDKDKSGTVSLSELKHSFANMGREIPQNVVEIFESVDVDESEEINYNEFIAAAMCKRVTIDEEKLVLAFEAMDTENTGYLTREGIENGVGQMLKPEELDAMMLEVDTNKDGKIDYGEFLVFWRQLYVDTRVQAAANMAKSKDRESPGLSSAKNPRPLIRSASLSPRSLDYANQKSFGMSKPLPKLKEKRHSIECGTHLSKSGDMDNAQEVGEKAADRVQDTRKVLPKIGSADAKAGVNKIPFMDPI
mmetsp:Transcript_16866/g.31668  ORF Transcript_16866/g.31668 Transcript_16866/m.31668 type:complete len:257 (-) Transcript_16866:454-1224(-)